MQPCNEGGVLEVYISDYAAERGRGQTHGYTVHNTVVCEAVILVQYSEASTSCCTDSGEIVDVADVIIKGPGDNIDDWNNFV